MYKFLLLILLTTFNLDAAWIDRKAEGWAWYEDKKETLNKAETKPEIQKTASETLAEIRKELEEKMAIAIINPTEENVKTYMEFQQKLVNQSAMFGSVWSKILLNYPQLDQTIDHPVSQYGITLQKEIEDAKKKEFISRLASENGLFFFYEGKSKVSQALSQVVNIFAREYQWKVMPISMDGFFLESFPESRGNNGIAKKIEVPVFPALYIISPSTQTATPIAFGFVTLDQLEKNTLLQYQTEKEQ